MSKSATKTSKSTRKTSEKKYYLDFQYELKKFKLNFNTFVEIRLKALQIQEERRQHSGLKR